MLSFHPPSGLVAVAFSLGSLIGAAAQEPAPASTKKPPPEAPPGFIVLDEAAILPLAGLEPRVVLVAHTRYLAKEYSQAAAELRKAASLMRLAVGSATQEGRDELERTIQAVDGIAGRLESGDAISAQEFERTLGLAQWAFARGHYMKARSDWVRKMDVQWAGQHLKAAAIDLLDTRNWLQEELGPEAIDGLDRAAELGDRLSRNMDVADADVQESLQAIGQHLHDLGRTLTANPPAVQPKLQSEAYVPGWVVVEARPMLALVPEIELAFERARAQYDAHKSATAAKEIRQAAGVMRVAEAMAVLDSRQRMGGAIADLHALAADLDSGTVVPVSRLTGAFARADLALAIDDCAQAKEGWSKNDLTRTRRYLLAAAQHVRQAADWRGEDPGKETGAAVVARAEQLAASLGKADADEVTIAQGFEAIEKELSALTDKRDVKK